MAGFIAGYRDGKCLKCGLERTKEGHDPCIANLPGVTNACCGHGTHQAYVLFENGLIIRGDFEETLLGLQRRPRHAPTERDLKDFAEAEAKGLIVTGRINRKVGLS